KSVTDFNLSIDRKEFIIFVGPSGCGKSTTLRMLAGFEEISGGTISIDGTVVNDKEPKERGISMVFQNYALYPHMTVEDNIAFGLKNIKTPKDEIKKKVDWVVEILGLEEYRKSKPKNLSGGQRQRVALGRAIVRDQKVFLMDEPLSNLDAKLRVSMRNEISKLHRQLGATTIYVTHDQVEAMTMADRIVVMKDGIIQQIGSPMELYDNPKNKFVASFIGAPQMNFLPVEVKGNEAVFDDGKKIIIPGGIVKKLNGRSGKLLMGVRGEDIKLDNLNLGLFEESVFTSVIDNTEIMGNENNIYFKIGNTNVIARVGKEDVKQIGESFKFVINANKIHFFDLETEENIMN
ncbi:sn-glycerol-3-phosphate ABC transporter ATP-binding protein UgpC, partial [uncultured Clostridium sp.]|uniref:ABC transporter ATP-binding protein n=1 Tax=uncultured Clostridium sp. TaxID=59620 RepID=UPI0025D0CEAF